MGNICRSPTAEAVFRDLAAAAGIEVRVDSAGTGGWHAGEPPDRRARDAAAKRGYQLTGAARQVRRSDFVEYDLIVAMDADNLADLLALAPPGTRSKVRLLVPHGVPDPYYGGPQGFDRVIDIVERGCRELLDELGADVRQA
jgi:protein-tyrosine phosphatase